MSNDESDEKIPAKVEEFELFLCLKGLSAGDSVLKVKQKIASLLPDTPIEHQRVIYNGRILDDDQVLSHYSIAHQSTLFLVVSKTSKKGSENSNAAAAAAVSRSTATDTAPPSVAPAPPQPTVPPSSSSEPSFAQNLRQQQQMMQQQGGYPSSMMMRVPASAQQLLNSPFMQRLLDNPDFMTNLLQSQLESNPALQRMMDDNPSLRHMLDDPAALQQAAELLRNPAALQQAMRQQDLALSQLENMPGGFAALSNMYRNVQAPLEESLTEQAQQSRQADVPPQRHEDQGATGTAMPNPWGSSPSTTARSSSSAPSQESFDLNSLLQSMSLQSLLH